MGRVSSEDGLVLGFYSRSAPGALLGGSGPPLCPTAKTRFWGVWGWGVQNGPPWAPPIDHC
jgi:hypothetical protein